MENLHLGIVPLETTHAFIFAHTVEDWISHQRPSLSHHHPQGTVLIAPP